MEAARHGAVFATNGKAYARWRRSLDSKLGKAKALTGAALESAVLNVARMFPDNVVRATGAAR